MLSATSSPWIAETLEERCSICLPQIAVPAVSTNCPCWDCFCIHNEKKKTLYCQKYWSRAVADRKQKDLRQEGALKTRYSFFQTRPYRPRIHLLPIIIKIICISELKLRLGQSPHDLFFFFFRKCHNRYNYNVL